MNHSDIDTAVKEGDLEAFKEAVGNSAPLDIVTYRYPHGETYLHWAATAENGEELVKYMVDDLGAMVNINNWYGATPLYYACSKGQKASIDTLLERGADTREISTFSGYNCVDMAHSCDPLLLDETGLRQRHDHILASLQNSAYFEYYYRRILSWRLAYWKRMAPNKSTVQVTVPPDSKEMSDIDLFLRCKEDERLFVELLAMTDDEICIGCGRVDGLKRCTSCKRAKFCSDSCLKKTWNIHKHMCDEYPERRDFHTRSYESMRHFNM